MFRTHCQTPTGVLTLPNQTQELWTKKNPQQVQVFQNVGGEGGIRTPGRDEPTSDFKSGALNRALPPLRDVDANTNGVF